MLLYMFLTFSAGWLVLDFVINLRLYAWQESKEAFPLLVDELVKKQPIKQAT